MKDVLKRLVRLEGGAALTQPNPSNGVPSLLQASLVAAWYGNLQTYESVAEAHSQAPKYNSVQSYQLTLMADRTEWNSRHYALWQHLPDEQGVDAGSLADEQITGLARLLEPVPAHIVRMLQRTGEVVTE